LNKLHGSVQKKGNSSNITTNITLNENITAPIQKGDVLGKAEFHLDDELIASTNLIAEESIKKLNAINMFERITNIWSSLLR
jgi:D-alanyl-D-alanine carboxypeptidase (penicillin-binding protein 5/6)